MKESLGIHIISRIIFGVVLFIIAIPVSHLFIDTDSGRYYCGMAYIVTIIFWEIIFYIFWVIFLLIEAINLHRRKLIENRNTNIIMVLALPIFLLLVSLFFWIKDLVD